MILKRHVDLKSDVLEGVHWPAPGWVAVGAGSSAGGHDLLAIILLDWLVDKCYNIKNFPERMV